jgi:hypothetical protein
MRYMRFILSLVKLWRSGVTDAGSYLIDLWVLGGIIGDGTKGFSK